VYAMKAQRKTGGTAPLILNLGTIHINKLCGQNTEFLSVKPGGT